MITYSAIFHSADAADRAAAWLRSRGVDVRQYHTTPKYPVELEPGLVVGYPYSYPANTASSDYSTGLINGLPQTDGNAVIVPLPFFEQVPGGQVEVRLTVADADAERARKMLVNSGGLETKIVH